MSTKYLKMMLLGILFFILISCKTMTSDLNIVNGEFVDGKYPTVVQIKEKIEDNGGCSSIIVSDNVILTAAHCFFLAEKKENLGTEINGKFIRGSSYTYLDEFRKRVLEEDALQSKTWDILRSYLDRKIDRSKYESKTKAILKNYKYPAPYDLAVIIFDNINGSGPFKSIIEKAKTEGVFFQLSKNTFENGTVFKDDKNSIFFLGFGASGKYEELTDVLRENGGSKYTNRKQLGYNSFTYNKDGNEWHSPKPINNNLDNSLFAGSNINFGDSGGPLIYKNQILGVASDFYSYDCEGNPADGTGIFSDVYLGKQEDGTFLFEKNSNKCNKDPYCGKIKYASSRYASITLGNPQVKDLLKQVKNELSKKGLLESNSIFSELVK